jgi:hypothetical protein
VQERSETDQQGSAAEGKGKKEAGEGKDQDVESGAEKLLQIKQ